MTGIAYVNCTVITAADGQSRLDDAAFVVDAGRFVAVGARGEVDLADAKRTVDLDGAFVLPGLWDAHIHLGGLVPPHENGRRETDPRHHMARCVAKAQENLRWGITSVRSMGERDGADLLVRDLVEDGTLVGPRVVASGDVSWCLRETGVDNFRRRVRGLILDGVDQVKLLITGGIPFRGAITSPGASRAELTAAINEAHAWGRPVAVHAMGDDAVIMAAECGADTIEHAFGCTVAAAEAMAAAGTVFCPNLAVTDQWTPQYIAEAGLPTWFADNAVAARHGHHETLAAAVELGVTICAGVDNLPRPDGSVGVETVGDTPALFTEMALLRANGLSARESLRAATLNTARVCARGDDLGSVEAGKIADFVVVDGDPEVDLATLTAVAGVWQAGVRRTVRGGADAARDNES